MIEAPEVKPDVNVLLEAFQHFEKNAKKLEAAYLKMQDDFQNVNIELDSKNNFLSQILQNLTNSVVAIDADGIITGFNQAAEKLTGHTKKDVVGLHYRDALGEGVSNEQSLLYTLSTGKHIAEQEKAIPHKDGYSIPVSFTTCILEDGHGKLIGALEVLRDLSEVKRMQEEIQRSKTLAALGEMSAAVAHEIRNPLGAIGGFVTLLERDLEKQPQQLDLVRKIIASLSSLNKIVSNLLLYTRPLALQLQHIDIGDHVGQVMDFVAIGLQDSMARFEKKFPVKPVVMSVDPEKLNQVLINLIQNAVQAIPGEGVVTVTISEKCVEGKEKLFLRGIRQDRIVYIDIEDTGKGIKEEDQGKLFNPFFTTRVDGNGLGLSIVKKIVELHGGEITLDSIVGKGTVFTVALPA
jgi:PAS domain S-box-containing protein